MFRVLLAAIMATLILTASDRAAGDLIYKGVLENTHTSDFPGKGTHFVWSATDPTGDSFTMNVVDGNYFQGHIVDKLTLKGPVDYDFGRCTYRGGKNDVFAETDSSNNFVAIGWINIDPKSLHNNSEVPLQKQPKETISGWIERITPLIKDEHLTVHIYSTVFGDLDPGTQTVTTYVNGALKDPTFPASLASTYYLADGNSVDPDLAIDPEMRIPGMSDQEADSPVPVPEPSSLIVFATGAVFASVRWFFPRKGCRRIQVNLAH